MIDPVTGAAAAAPSSYLQLVEPTPAPPGGRTAAPTAAASNGAGAQSTQPATRVYVDRSEVGVYVYRLVDAATGRVLAELPRAQSGSLKVSDNYEPGAVTSASV